MSLKKKIYDTNKQNTSYKKYTPCLRTLLVFHIASLTTNSNHVHVWDSEILISP